MATALDIITLAFRKAAMVSDDETLTSDQAAHGLTTLNMMIHGWKLQGADTTHTTMVQTDTFPLSAEYEEGTVYLLAGRLSSDYIVPVSFDADAFFRDIQAAYTTITAAALPSALLNLPSHRRSNGTAT